MPKGGFSMPKYTANAYLVKDRKIVKPDEEIELTKEQAARLGDKLQDAPGIDEEAEEETEGEQQYTESSLRKLSADEQKVIVEQLGGDLEEITNQDERIDYILNNQ